MSLMRFAAQNVRRRSGWHDVSRGLPEKQPCRAQASSSRPAAWPLPSATCPRSLRTPLEPRTPGRRE
eukprot:5807091-Pyramimonas_sp.AAC.1